MLLELKVSRAEARGSYLPDTDSERRGEGSVGVPRNREAREATDRKWGVRWGRDLVREVGVKSDGASFREPGKRVTRAAAEKQQRGNQDWRQREKALGEMTEAARI